MNAVLTIPALSILVGLWKENPWSIPWTFKSLSLFCIVVTDSWFAFIIISGLYEQVWLSSLLFGAEYIILAGGLLWFNKFIAVYKDGSEKKQEAPFPRRNDGRIRYLQVSVAIVIVGGVVSYGLMGSMTTGSAQYITPADAQVGDTLTVGALLPLSGALASYGQEAEVALKIAAGDANAQLAGAGSAKRVSLVIEDTRTDPGVALEKMQAMAAEGIRIVIGPVTSAEVAAVKQFADESGVLVVSIGSTAPDLAIPGDNVLRLVPDDTRQAEVLARQMWDDGVRVVVPMWRADVFGNNLHRLLEEDFTELGGTVVDGVAYEPLVGDFSSSLHRINFIIWEQNLRLLAEKVGEVGELHGADSVGVYVVAFDEIVPILIQADRHPELAAARWYGSDGSAQVGGVVRNADAAEFAITTNFMNPIYGVEETDEFRELEDRIAGEIGREPRSYAEATYDALRVAVMALDGDPVSPRDEFVRVAGSYAGATGNTELNEAGDRKSGSYDFWAVREGHGGGHDSYEWASVATFAIE
jgi:branched-chain amino acid transport system substrate-binding protein